MSIKSQIKPKHQNHTLISTLWHPCCYMREAEREMEWAVKWGLNHILVAMADDSGSGHGVVIVVAMGF